MVEVPLAPIETSMAHTFLDRDGRAKRQTDGGDNLFTNREHGSPRREGERNIFHKNLQQQQMPISQEGSWQTGEQFGLLS